MNDPGEHDALGLLVWDTRRRILRGAAIVGLIAAGTAALGGISARRRSVGRRRAPRANEGDAARAARERGDEHRRAGRTIEALRAYGEATGDPRARADTRRKSRYGAARARLDVGEITALEELARLAESELAPHEIARARAAILRFEAVDEDAVARVNEAARRCLRALRSRAEAHDIDGVRARGWLARVEHHARAR